MSDDSGLRRHSERRPFTNDLSVQTYVRAIGCQAVLRVNMRPWTKQSTENHQICLMRMGKYTVIYPTSIYCLIQVTYTVKVVTADEKLQSFDTDYCDLFQVQFLCRDPNKGLFNHLNENSEG